MGKGTGKGVSQAGNFFWLSHSLTNFDKKRYFQTKLQFTGLFKDNLVGKIMEHWKVNKNEQGEGGPNMCVRLLF